MNCEVTSAANTNLAKAVRAAAPVPSSLSIWTRVASPAALWVGSGRSTRRCWLVGGPPSEAGSRKFQPTETPNAGTLAAAGAGMTIISGERATSNPAGWMSRAPIGKLRATSTHRLESGIQASTAGRLLAGPWPSTCAATVAGAAVVIRTSAQ